MGQLWDRLRRFGESYVNDFIHDDPDYSKLDPKILEELKKRATGRTTHRGYETEEERLKRMIDEAANPQPKQQSQHHTHSQQHRQAPPHQKYGGMGLEEALRVLGLPANASVDDMKKQYKKLMLQYHPDRVSNLDPTAQHQARDKAQRINAAYEVIKVLKGL